MTLRKPLEWFVQFQHYSPEDSKLKQNGKTLPALKLKPPGIKLIAEYYREKYQANITISYLDSIRNLTDEKVDDAHFKKRFDDLLKDINSNKDPEYRQAILIGSGGKHGVALIYLREKGQAAFLLSDSFYNISDSVSKLYKRIPNADKIKFYHTDLRRQRDGFSCYTDAVIFARDATAKNPDGIYRVPNLLSKLIARSGSKGELQVDLTLLPDDFLKTSQYPEHIIHHREKGNTRTIHRKLMMDAKAVDETLEMFRSRYADTNVVTRDLENKPSEPGYLRKKALKMANIIEIQFYTKQLKEIFNLAFTKELRDAFIKQAKAHLAKQEDAAQERLGLHQFVEAFIKSHEMKLNSGKLEAKEVAPTAGIVASALTKPVVNDQNSGRCLWTSGKPAAPKTLLSPNSNAPAAGAQREEPVAAPRNFG